MDTILYKSTRNKEERITSSEAIIKGLANDGGLFVPVEIPSIDMSFGDLKGFTYQELALYIMKKYFVDFSEGELKGCIDRAYDEKFNDALVAPLNKKGNAYFLELYHGPTLAFKDMALSILPHLMKTAGDRIGINEEIVILTATSGDTGKAALEGFADVDGTKIIVFFPVDGVSDIQKKQMTTQEGKNTHVIGIKGNFDDAQRGVKEIFNDREFNNEILKWGYRFSSANSINIGRLVPQIVYYFNSYINMLKNNEIKENEVINICVPTGNFGNILAAYYAKRMGLPVNKLICASNENNVLYDFINTGIYDKRRDFKKTSSPSMDILVSSNLERLLYEFNNHDEEGIKDMMKKLNENGVYEITTDMKERLKDFYGGYSTDKEVNETIKEVFEEYNYLIDTHTAVAYHVYKQYKNSTGDETKTIIASTASPFKFTRSVMESITNEYDDISDFELIKEMSKIASIKIPVNIKDIEKREELHKDMCDKNDIKDTIIKLLKK